MKGKNHFTEKEIACLRELISVRCNTISKSKQKTIRDKMRDIGFYGRDDFGIIDMTIEKFESLVANERIIINKEDNNISINRKTEKKMKKIRSRKLQNTKDYTNLLSFETLKDENRARKVKELSEDHFPSTPGVYVIRIDNIKALPSVISEELKKRKHNILYIGIASKSIRKRLWKQELHCYKGAATFFRSIGAILGYRPKPNSLSPSSYNYKFSTEDKYNIISWIESHLLVDFVESNENLKEVESELIKEFIPVVNIAKNPYRLEYVSSSRKECIDIAHGT